MIVLFGILLAIFWTGFLRVGSQISLLLAPVAMVLLVVGWLSLPAHADRASAFGSQPGMFLATGSE